MYLLQIIKERFVAAGADLGGGCRGCAPPPEMTCGFLINTVQSASQLYKICFIIWYVFSAVHIMLLPSRKPSSSYSLLKFVYVTSQLRHSLVVHPLLRKILDPPLRRNPIQPTHRKLMVKLLWNKNQLSLLVRNCSWQLFIQIFLTSLHTLAFFGTVSGCKHRFSLAFLPFLPFPSSLLNKQLGHHAWKRGWSVVYCPWNLISKSIYHRSTSFPSQYTIDRINSLLLVSFKFGQSQLVMKNKPGVLSQSETVKYI